MNTDDKVIKKILELFPDALAESTFFSLEQNMVLDEDLNLIRRYLSYVRKYNPVFSIRKLTQNHIKFYKSLDSLDDFILRHFFRLGSLYDSFVLQPDIKKSNLSAWNNFASELSTLLEEVRGNYTIFREQIEHYVLKNDSAVETVKIKKYSDIKEPIEIGTLGIIIKKDSIQKKGKESIPLNDTDNALVYLLYFNAQKNNDDSFLLEDIATELEVSVEYVRNRITYINKSIAEIISKTVRVKIGKFITKKKGYGYYLNPRILHIKNKK